MSKGAEVFQFNFENTDKAESFVFSGSDWGAWQGENVLVGDTVVPDTDETGESLAGSFTISVPLAHLDNVTVAYVWHQSEDVTVEYTTNGGTSWSALTNGAGIAVTNASDFDVRFNFAGGELEDPAHLDNVEVYLLNTKTIYSVNGSRTITYTNATMRDGTLYLTSTATITAGIPTGEEPNLNVGTFEAWVKTGPSPSVLNSPPAGTGYRDGVAGVPLANTLQHFVRTFTTPANSTLTLSANNNEISHLALYPQSMTAGEVATLYTANIGQKLVVHDTGSIQVTTSTPEVDIYAYTWTGTNT